MSKKRNRRQTHEDMGELPSREKFPETQFVVNRDYSTIQARSKKQKHYLNCMKQYSITFGTGPAGTGKTFLCGAVAAAALANGETNKIIITRPMVEADEDPGYLPGTAEEKFAPYFRPFKDVLDERLGASHVEYLIKRGRIEIAPFAYMRGRTFKNCWVILDEAQNTTPSQMKLFLTRLGENCNVVINGDLKQKDIKGKSGLQDAIDVLQGHTVNMGFCNFSEEDIVRSAIVQEIVEAYNEVEN